MTRRYDHASMVADYQGGLSFTEVARKHGADVSLTRKVVIRSGCPLRPVSESRLRGENHPMWRGGVRKLSDGYIGTEDGRLHRVEAERMIGRSLEAWEDVHHVDGDKVNNSEENLVVMPEREHQRFHTFLLHRRAAVSRENLELFCRRESSWYFRFTTADFRAASAAFPMDGGSRLRVKESRKCRIPACGAKHYGKGYCSKHYQRQKALRAGKWASGNGRSSRCRMKSVGEAK